jgi:hypothetical protein
LRVIHSLLLIISLQENTKHSGHINLFDDIKEIVKNRNGSFTIKGKDVTDAIFVPAQIENYAQLQEK